MIGFVTFFCNFAFANQFWRKNIILMIHSKLNILWVGILLLLAVSFCFQSCRQGRNKKQDGLEKNAQTGSVVSNELAEFGVDDLSFETFLQPLAPGSYYMGECWSPDGTYRKSFVLILKDVKEKSFSATFYDITDSLKTTVKPEKMSGAIKMRSFVLTCDAFPEVNSRVLHKIMLAKTKTGIKGSFTTQKQPFEFVLNRYEPPEYKEFEERYNKEVFPCKIIKNVKYGEAMGYWTSNVTEDKSYLEIFAKGVSASAKKKKLELLMDIYLPENDDLESRPLILFIHGGAFYIGDKADNPVVLWCKHFAACGYVAASINYRMGFQLTKASIERCGYCAVQDAHAAMRFLLSKKEEYRINPDYIFVAGSSAGAITSLNLAFMRNATRPESSYKHGTSADLGDIESSGNSLKQDFHIRAVANMWGAVNDLNLLSASKTAIISFHGNADKLVPYDEGIPFSDMKVKVGGLFFNKMYGSAAIHRKARQLGYREAFHTFEGLGHAPHVDKNNQPTQEFYFIKEHITDFFYGEFVPPATAVRREPGRPQWFRLDGEELADVRWKVEGGFILKSAGNRVRVVFVEGVTHSLHASALWKNGAASTFHTDL